AGCDCGKYFGTWQSDQRCLDADAGRAVAMRHCAAFEPSSVSPEFWMPCTAPAIGRGLYCVVHRDAVDGAMLGMHAARVMPPRIAIRAKKGKRCNAKARIATRNSASCTQCGASRSPRL